jgi:ribosomal protein L16 Arg81 hydroxylase
VSHPEDEGKIPDVDKTNLDEMALLLLKKITEMKSTFENKFKSEQEVAQKERDSSELKIEELEKQLSAESHARRLLETQLIQDKRESETRLREALAQVPESSQLFSPCLSSSHAFALPSPPLLSSLLYSAVLVWCRLRNQIKAIKWFGI